MNTSDKLARLVDLPSLPAILMEALQNMGNNQNFSELADKISKDPPIVIRILRIANSPFYGMSREIGSLREAIVLLGINRIRDILVSACFMNLLPSEHKEFNYVSFWQHSLSVAYCARHIGIYTGIGEDIVFTAGLLHDIGILVMVLLFPDEYSRIIKSIHPHRMQIERQIVGYDHVEIGSKVAQQWNFPVAIQKAIEQHETPPTRSAAATLGGLIYTANLLIKNAELNNSADLDSQEQVTQVLAYLEAPLEQALSWIGTSRQFANDILASR